MATSEKKLVESLALERDVKILRPNAFLVLPRVLRRVIKKDLDLATLTRKVPHRKSYVISGREVARYVAADELGLSSLVDVPPQVLLIQRPDDLAWKRMPDVEIRRRTWRLLYHVSVDAHLQTLHRHGKLSPRVIRQRIDQVGQVEFDEIISVLYREHFLPDRDHILNAYLEFAAVYTEFYFFNPSWLPIYFPSLSNPQAVMEILSQDFNPHSLLRETQLPGCLNPQADSESEAAVEEVTPDSLEERTFARPNPRRYAKAFTKGETASDRGNPVRAAIAFHQAKKFAVNWAELEEAESRRMAAVTSLVSRLKIALEMSDEESDRWLKAISVLVDHSTSGFWTADKKLLYDLQKVCVDHERGVYCVDLLEWLRTFGKRPIKRALPNQREVLMSKHLRSASKRLVSARLSGQERHELEELLHAAAHSAEKQLRRRLRPLIEETLRKVDLLPANVPEEVAWHKLVEELSDYVVQRGYLTFGNFRDSLSRSQLKLPDLAGIKELWKGDRLLKADKEFDDSLDGVYHRGEFYLRWLQSVSSVAFGTRIGRFITKHLVLPFGGAYVILAGLKHLVELIIHFDEDMHATERMAFPWLVLIVGGFISALLHIPPFRAAVTNFFAGIFRGVKSVLVEFPTWLARLPVVRRAMKSTLVAAVRHYILWPGIITLLVCYGVPWMFDGPGSSTSMTVAVFLALNMILNSRLGRDCEEITSEWVVLQWQRIRVGVFVTLFEVIMDFFKWLVESLERFLYAVDEWLRFRTGEGAFTLALKAGLGVIWAGFAYVTRFAVNLLIEPQINPIKHFPVVTVSHKIILPTQPMFANLLKGPFDPITANAIAGGVVTVIPGVFGFLVWELKSNWQLYAANRSDHLYPVIVGDHGETIIQVMKPGFHSGTLPKLFHKMRKAERKPPGLRRTVAKSKYLDKLHHLEISLRHFVQREFLAQLKKSPAWETEAVSVGKIRMASNNLRISFTRRPDEEPFVLWFQEQSGWLVAGILQPGWVLDATPEQRADLNALLSGFYKLSGVDLVREQIASNFTPRIPPYDIAEGGLVMWPAGEYETEVLYNLHQNTTLRPKPRSVARRFDLPTLHALEMIYKYTLIRWDQWVNFWTQRKARESADATFIPPECLLPPCPPTPAEPPAKV